jgi:heme exporter protein D
MNAPDVQAGSSPPVADRREEHDDLARRLAIRRSVDEARKGLIRLFLGLLAVGLSVRLAWDRWGPLAPGAVRKLHRGPPLLLWIAVALAVALLVLAVRALLASRRLARDEDRLYARFRRLRAELGLDR